MTQPAKLVQRVGQNSMQIVGQDSVQIDTHGVPWLLHGWRGDYFVVGVALDKSAESPQGWYFARLGDFLDNK